MTRTAEQENPLIPGDTRAATQVLFDTAVSCVRHARAETNPRLRGDTLKEAEKLLEFALRAVIPSMVRGEIEVQYRLKPSDRLRRGDRKWKKL